MSSILRAVELRKLYGDTVGIDDVDITVERGDMVGFIGPNGAGKSTTIRVLLGLLKPTAGRAFVLGEESWQLPRATLSRIGYLPSSVRYYDRMRVGAFLAATSRFYGRDSLARARELCERLDVDTRRRFGELSLGNRKKVGVVQCFMHRPDLVVLDEPTSGLDPLIQSRFFDLVEEENDRGVTVFLSSHTLSEVQEHCRSVVIIRGGRIVETGEVSQLRRRQYRRVRIVAEEPVLRAVTALESATVESTADGAATILYQGPMAPLLACLAGGGVHDLLIEEPSLEEIFLHYYRSDDERSEDA